MLLHDAMSYGGRTALLAILWLHAPAGAGAAWASPPRVPIEVEVQPGAAACAPGYKRFDEGFRATLTTTQLVTTNAAGEEGAIANSFCLASEMPGTKPLRVRVRIRGDGGASYDYVAPGSPDPISKADHWLVHVAVPFKGFRLAPARWRRSSLWARADRERYCETMGRVIALHVLEALHHETGRLPSNQVLALGSDVNRDPKYSEGGEGLRSVISYAVGRALPAAVAWSVVLLVVFSIARAIVRRRRDAGA